MTAHIPPAGLIARCRRTTPWSFLASLPERFRRPTAQVDYIPQIDGLRALALALVVVWHEALRVLRQGQSLVAAGHPFPDLYTYFPHGEIGVGLFFVISGVVIAQPLLAKPLSPSRIGVFYWRRLRRLYPPYLAILIPCYLIALTGVVRDRDIHHIPYNESLGASLVYMHGWLFNLPSRFNPPLWSLEVEIQFYALAPFLFLLYLRLPGLKSRVFTGLTAALMAALMSGVLNRLHPFDGRFRFGLLAHAHLFLLGIVLADLGLADPPLRRPARRRYDVAFFGGCALLVGLGLLLTRVDARPPGVAAHVAADLAEAAVITMIYVGAMRGVTGRWLMARPWICLIGAMCYSIYLVHVVVIEAVSQLLARLLPLDQPLAIWGLWVPVLTAAIGVSGLLFYIAVERPFMNRGSVRPLWSRFVTSRTAEPRSGPDGRSP